MSSESPSGGRRWPPETIAAAAAAGIAGLAALLLLPRPNRGPDDPQQPHAVALDAPLTLDSATRTGELKNGLRYFVRPHDAPSGSAELRLVVDAGSVLEEEDQRGLAHAVEHMVFRGTSRFPGRRAIDFLQGYGVREGEDVNASTGLDETVYRITVPTDSAGVLDTALAILADWAHAATFDSAAARREAGVVFEEWRSRTGAHQRLMDARDTLLMAGSRYAARAPIGDTTVLRRFDLEAMRRFYRDWYRPELMAVVAVGDFDPDRVERMVSRLFGAIPASAQRRKRPELSVRRTGTARAAVFRDAEVEATRIALWFPRDRAPARTVRDYRGAFVEVLARDILNARLDAAADRPDSPLLNAGVGLRWLARPLEAHVVSATAVEGRVPEAVVALAEETARLHRFAVAASELEQAKQVLLRRYAEAASFGDYSDELADALVEHYAEGDPVLGEERDYLLAQRLLPSIYPSDLQRFARRRMALDSGAAVVVTLPAQGATPRSAAPAPTAAMLPDAMLAAARAGAERAAEPARDSVVQAELMTAEPEPGPIFSRRTLGDPVNAVEWTLRNGMRVILKPTEWDSDEVLLRMTAPGGASLAAPADYPSAYMADRVLEATGVGSLSGARLTRMLDATSVSLAPVVTEDWVQLSGSAAPRDLRTLFQLAHLYLTAPRADSAAFRRYRQRARTYARSREADPEAAFADSVAAALRPVDSRGLPAGRAFTDAIAMEPALRFWRARAANASNFTVVIVGSFGLERVRPLVERYLGSLPAGRPESPRDVGPRFRTGVVERSFRRGVDPRARTELVFTGPIARPEQADPEIDAVGDLVEMVLQGQLRELLGGTYGVSVERRSFHHPRAEYAIHVAFTAAPERIDSLVQAAQAELERLRTVGPTAEELERVKAAQARDAEDDYDGNRFWAHELVTHSRLGWPLEGIAAHRDDARRISVATLRNGCRAYLDPSRMVRVTMYPAAAPPAR